MENCGFHDSQANLGRPAPQLHLAYPPQVTTSLMLPAPSLVSSRAAHCTPACFRILFTSVSPLSLGCLPGSRDCALITSYPMQRPGHLCFNSPDSPGPSLEDRLEQTESRAVPEQGPWSCGPPASIRVPVSSSQPFPLHPSLHSPPLVFSHLSHLSSEPKMMLFSCFASQAAPGDEGGNRHPQEPGLASVFSVVYRQEPRWPHQAAHDTCCSCPCWRVFPFRSPGRFQGKKGREGCWSLEHPVQTADSSPQADPANAQTGHILFSNI